MFHRTLSTKLKKMARQLPVVVITGPRQSGKTTLVKMTFPKKAYSSLENLDNRNFALSDPRRFLDQFKEGAILDEAQRTPDLFSYLQEIIDTQNKPGQFIITGSQQILLMENLSQSLAGRTSLLTLLPLSLSEIPSSKQHQRLEPLMFRGFFPRMYNKRISPYDWYSSYIRTYIERDVRLLKNIGDLHLFQKFIRMCAARSGQLLNLTALGNDCGVSSHTVKSWMSLLEASYIIFLVRPYHRNFNKRLVKNPKLYFFDTGLLCHLLGLEKEKDLESHASRGAIFETFVISELMKQRLHQGRSTPFYFWRDKTGHEIDCVIEKTGQMIPIEIKSGKTINNDFFKNFTYLQRLTKSSLPKPFLIYAGDQSQNREHAHVVSWRDLNCFASI